MKKIRFGLPLLVLCAALFLSGTARAAEGDGSAGSRPGGGAFGDLAGL